MRVQLVIPEMAVGGAERVVIHLVDALCARGVPVALAAGAGPLDAELTGYPVERTLLAGRGRSPLAVARSAAALRRAVGGFGPTVIHAHNVKATAFSAAARLGRPARPGLLATYQAVTPEEERTASAVFRLADHVACVSGALRDGLLARGFSSERSSVVYNAVTRAEPLTAERRLNLDRELGLGNVPVIAIVGRLVPQKAHGRFLDAAALVGAKRPDARFLVIGDGPLRAEVEADAARRGLCDRVSFTGARRDVRDLIARADVLVFSSNWEGLSLAALEALAAGTPVLSTDVAGTRELLTSGAGSVVPQDGAALGHALLELIEDPAARAEMGREGTRLAGERFSVERMVDDYLNLYERVQGAGR